VAPAPASALNSHPENLYNGCNVEVHMNQISISPGIRFGKPCVDGTRIAVNDVLELIRDGASFEEIRKDFYPDLSEDNLRACLQYAIDLVSKEQVELVAP
jgi:uncharacterized protein (DUF433 family)